MRNTGLILIGSHLDWVTVRHGKHICSHAVGDRQCLQFDDYLSLNKMRSHDLLCVVHVPELRLLLSSVLFSEFLLHVRSLLLWLCCTSTLGSTYIVFSYFKIKIIRNSLSDRQNGNGCLI